MKLFLGSFTLFGGLALLFVRWRGGDQVPVWIARLAVGLTALGVSTLLSAHDGLPWSIASIVFSIIAIAILASVLWEMLHRR